MSKARDLANSADVFDTVSTTELGYLDGVTSNIQTQIDGKTGGVATDTPPASPTEGQVWLDTDGTTADAEFVLKSTLSSTGDIFYASSANTPARLGIGSTNQVLKVSGGIPTWSAGGKLLQVISAETSASTSISTTSYTDTAITATITPTLNTSKILVMIMASYNTQKSTSTSAFVDAQLLRGASVIADWNGSDGRFVGDVVTGASYVQRFGLQPVIYMDSPASTSALTYKLQAKLDSTASGAAATFQFSGATSSIILMEIGA